MSEKISQAKKQGSDAYLAGTPCSNNHNPYNYQSEFILWCAWVDGWEMGKWGLAE